MYPGYSGKKLVPCITTKLETFGVVVALIPALFRRNTLRPEELNIKNQNLRNDKKNNLKKKMNYSGD